MDDDEYIPISDNSSEISQVSIDSEVYSDTSSEFLDKSNILNSRTRKKRKIDMVYNDIQGDEQQLSDNYFHTEFTQVGINQPMASINQPIIDINQLLNPNNLPLNIFMLPPFFNDSEDYSESDITEDVPEEVNTIKNKEMQKKIDYFKNEVIKLNQNKTGSLSDQILLSNFDINTKAYLYNKFEECNASSCQSDRSKMIDYIKQALRLPIGVYNKVFDKKQTINDFLLDARNKLDSSIYGMENTKEEIMDFLVKHVNKSMNGDKYKINTVLALQGPKGTGKTKICRALSEILNLPLFQLSFGGMTDSSILLGHDRTYIGSKSGRIANIMQDAKCMNPIIFLDEIDKIGESHYSKEVYGVLTHMLDETQNNNFNDLYLEGIPIDLSNVLFIASFNNIEDIDPIVLNRMKVIKIESLKKKDKIEVIKNFLLPTINVNNFSLLDSVIDYIITHKTVEEDGMRNINKNVETVINRLNTIKTLKGCANYTDITNKFSYSKLIDTIKYNDNNEFIITERTIDILLDSSNESNSDNSWRMMYL